jgi:acetylornithine deacetylase/succinyl-diaminopimelate desuccinylase-like protein
MLTVLKWLQTSGTQLRGRLYWAINNEGRSSHACTEAIVGALDNAPEFAIVQVGTGLRLSLGNRGRIDVVVHVAGRATHSSLPDRGLSAIDGAQTVLERLRQLSWPDHHPLLGGRHAIPYKIRYEPLAPHTLPSDAFITIDRRLLPGDDPLVAVEEIRDVIGDLSPYQVDVQPDAVMLPALVDPDDPGVQALQAAHAAERGTPADVVHGQGTFDAGGTSALGIPTVMYGASGGGSLLGTDFVTVSDVETEVRVLARLILTQLG